MDDMHKPVSTMPSSLSLSLILPGTFPPKKVLDCCLPCCLWHYLTLSLTLLISVSFFSLSLSGYTPLHSTPPPAPTTTTTHSLISSSGVPALSKLWITVASKSQQIHAGTCMLKGLPPSLEPFLMSTQQSCIFPWGEKERSMQPKALA